MNVVVTGGAGYVGSLVVAKLVDRGHSVRVVDELLDGARGLEAVRERIEVVQADPLEVQPCWLRDADAVIHLAGLHEWSGREEDVDANWLANAVATERLAMACRAMRVPRLTYASTCAVYGHLPAGYEYHEATPVRPRSAFAASRFYGERRLQQLADAAFCPVILRQAMPYGHSPRAQFETTPNRFVLDAVSLGRVTLPRNAWIARPFVDVDDLAEAHVQCLEAPAERVAGQVFNVVHVNLPIRSVGSIVVEVVGNDGGYVRVSAAESQLRSHDCRCSHARLSQAVGFTPGKPLLAAVQSMVRYLRETSAPAQAAGTALAAPPSWGAPLFCLPARQATERVSGSYTCWTGTAFD